MGWKMSKEKEESPVKTVDKLYHCILVTMNNAERWELRYESKTDRELKHRLIRDCFMNGNPCEIEYQGKIILFRGRDITFLVKFEETVAEKIPEVVLITK